MSLVSPSFPNGASGEVMHGSFIAARLSKLSFATPQQAKASFYEISALLDAGRIELDISRLQGELLIGIRERITK